MFSDKNICLNERTEIFNKFNYDYICVLMIEKFCKKKNILYENSLVLWLLNIWNSAKK